MNCNTCLKPSKKQGTYNLNQVSGCNMEFVVEEIKKINTNDEVPYLKNLVGKKLNFLNFEGCLRRPACYRTGTENISTTMPVEFPPYYDFTSFGALTLGPGLEKFSPRKSNLAM